MHRSTAVSDVSVVEITGSAAGAMCGRLLAGVGADVVMVEPEDGHPLRHGAKSATSRHYFETVAAGKRSVVVSPMDSSSVFEEMVTEADVVLTDYRVPFEGISESNIEGMNPESIYCSITPFGSDRTIQDWTETEGTVQAATGVVSTSGFPGGPPAITAVPVASAFSAVVGCGAILARLLEDSTGTIDVCMQDALFPLLTSFLPEYFATGEPVGRLGNRHPLMAPWNTYRAADGWVYLIAWADDQWERFLELADRTDLADDPRFETPQKRRQNADVVDAIVEEWTGRHTVPEAVRRAEAAGLTAAPICDVHEAFEDENLDYRGMIVDSNGHTIAGSPLRMSETPGQLRSSAPAPGSGDAQ